MYTKQIIRTAGLALLFGMAAAVADNHDPLAKYADPAEPALPATDVDISLSDTALVITDPQIDFLSPEGVTWGVDTAKAEGLPVFISPHHYYPTDHGWHFEGPLEKLMHAIGMFDREGPYTLEGYDGSGSDFMPEYKEQILDGETIIASPHKVYGPEQNDLVLQLRKRGVSKVILAGMSANLCTQAHLYELLEQGFEVAVVKDATAAAKLPEGDGYLAAITNFRYVANGLWSTDDAVTRIKTAR
jgi:nicotinamidase-related amidase